MPTAPYDTLEQALNAARTRLNDAIQSLGGSVLTDNEDFTPVICNNAWRWLQEQLVSRGFTALVEETNSVLAIPTVTNSSPAVEVWIDWTGCYDGTTLQASPVLPQNFIQAKDCWEDTGQGYQQMDEFKNGLPRIPKRSWLGSWEWRSNKLYFIGATQPVNVLVRYASAFPDFEDFSLVGPEDQPIPIMRAWDVLAWRIAYETASARGDIDGTSLASNADAAADRIFSRDTEVQTGIQQTSEYQKMKDPAYSPAGVTPSA